MSNRRFPLRWLSILAGLAMIATVALASASWAASGPTQPPGPPPPPGSPSLLHGLPHALDRLDLTSGQKTAIRAILDAQRQAADAQRTEMMAAHKALKDAVIAADLDETAIRQASAAVAALEADRAVADAALLMDVRAILTPEQRSQLQAFLESHGPGSGGFGPRGAEPQAAPGDSGRHGKRRPGA